jgi:formate hydrogenlyase transcriptional activator
MRKAQVYRESHFNVFDDSQRYQALLELTDLLARQRNPEELLPELSSLLRTVVSFELLSLVLQDPTDSSLRAYRWQADQIMPALSLASAEQMLDAFVLESQQPLLIADVQKETRFPQAVKILKEKEVRSYCSFPLTTAGGPLGALAFGSVELEAFHENDRHFLQRAAQIAALTLDNVLTRAAFQHEKELLEALLEVDTELLSSPDVQKLLWVITNLVPRVFQLDFAAVTLYDSRAGCLHVQAWDSPLAELIDGDALRPVAQSLNRLVFLHGETKLYKHEDLALLPSPFAQGLLDAGIQSLCLLPLIGRKGSFGTLNLGSKENNAFVVQDLNFLKQMAAQIALAWDNAGAYAEISELNEKLKEEKLYLREEIRSEHGFEEIIGESPALKRVLTDINTVAHTDATVLILGETGTGKELVARAIHRMSSRKSAGFIKLNCAAIPTGLLESELFGHEKGAFTGAVSQKIGLLELADQGTLFLDEVGEIPLELQPKLLRALQDQEFERLGGTRTIKVNVRIIAATNSNLAKSVAKHEFRSDLYYRLHVFPIRMPPLRERGKDIPLLVRHFVRKFAQRLNKQISIIPAEAMSVLECWHWPGNVRELENLIERSVILSQGSSLSVPFQELRPELSGFQHYSTLETVEREYILRVLHETGGVIAGLHGAAARLGMKRTTLQSRIKRLGITREEYLN